MNFTIKSQAEIESLNKEELTAYKNLGKKHQETEEFASAELETLASFHKSMSVASERLVEKALSGKASNEDVATLKAELKSMKDIQMKSMEKAMENMAVKLQKAKSQSISASSVKSFSEQVHEQLSKKENLETLQKLQRGEKVELEFSMKAAADITLANIIGDNSNLVPMPEQMGVVNIPQFVTFITDIVDTANTNSSTITWTDEVSPEGDAEFIGEGVLKPLLDMNFEPKITSAKKVAGRMRVSEESITDIPWLTAQINTKLKRRHDIKMENGILFGDSSSNSAQFDGITKDASAYVAGSSAGTILEPNNFDVIRASITQIINAGQGEFYPTHVLINPDDAAAMDMTKGNDGHYVLPSFVTNGGQEIKGVRVVEKPQLVSGSYLIGDMKMSHVRNYQSFRIKVGYDGNDFSKNMRTIIGESRAHHFISANEYNAFVYDTFANVKTVLEIPTVPPAG